MNMIFCSSKNLGNFTQVLLKRLNLPHKVLVLPHQQYFEHWNHKSKEELREEFLKGILDRKEKAIKEGFNVLFAYEDYSDFSEAEQKRISEDSSKFILKNNEFSSFNELILSIGKKLEAIKCIKSYMNCLVSYHDTDKTLPATDTLISNYTEIYKLKLKNSFDVKNIEFDNEELWDLEKETLNEFKAFIS